MNLIIAQTETIKLTTSAAGSIHYIVNYRDENTNDGYKDNVSEDIITTATTTTILSAPATNFRKKVYQVSIFNNGINNTVTLFKSASSDFIFHKCTLSLGESIKVIGDVVDVFDATGKKKVSEKDYLLEIQKNGFYDGKQAFVFNILGRRAGFTSTSVFNDIKEYDNAVANIPTLSNSTLDIISSSANDTSTGTGVRTVKVVYINNSNQLVESAVITLNGTTLVTSVLTGVNAILWMETETAGSGGVAAGNIRLRINGGTVEVEQISTGGNKSRSAFFMVPTGYTAYVKCIHGTAIGTTQDMRLRATVNSLDRSISNVYHYQDNLFLTSGQQGDSDIPMLKYPALSKIKVSTISGATPVANRADVSFQIILIAD